jgi:hypothetical protein
MDQGRIDFDVQYTEYTLSDIISRIGLYAVFLPHNAKPHRLGNPMDGIARAMGFRFIP